MKRAKLFLTVAACLWLWIGQPAYGADVAKIGVIDFQRLLEACNAGKYAQAEIRKRFNQMEAELKQKGAQIEEKKNRFEREALVMNKDMREEKEREIKINIMDFKALEKNYTQDLKEFENRLVKRIRDEVFALVQEMGKTGGYLLVVEKRGEVLYAPKSVDMTDNVIQKYNVEFGKNPEGQKKN